LPPRKRMKALSTGMRAALGIVVGLATRAPLTIYEESHLGLDAPSRYAFYDELLADYAEHPRTVIISTHLIDEVARLFEQVVIIDRGRLVVQQEADGLRARAVAVTGPVAAVDDFVDSAVRGGASLLAQRELGPTRSATLYGGLDSEQEAAARSRGLELGPV